MFSLFYFGPLLKANVMYESILGFLETHFGLSYTFV